jgi:rhodanese-related sulfurtransferase
MQKIALARHDVTDMLARMNPGGWQAHTVQVGPWHLGALTHPSPSPALAGWTGLLRWGEDVAVVSGRPLMDIATVHSADDLIAALRAADGVYAAALWRARDQSLHILSDFLGCQPLHRQGTDFASDSKAFDAAPDARGWGAFIAHGHSVGEDTLLAGVRRVKAAQHISFDAQGIESSAAHWAVPSREEPQALDALIDSFTQSVAAYAHIAPDAQFLLSGGYDSRIIAAALRQTGCADVASTILDHADEDGGADGWIANKVAQQLGWRTAPHIEALPDFFSSSAYLDHLWAVDGAYPTHGLFIAQVMQHVRGHGVWEGQLPNVSLRAIHPHGGFAAYDRDKRASANHPRWQAASRLFTPEALRHLQTAEAAATADSRAEFADDEIGVGHWVTLNRMRRRAGLNIYQAYGQRAVPLAAGMSRRFWSLVQSHPAALRREAKLVQLMLEAMAPDLAALPVSSGGAVHGRVPMALQLRMSAAQFLAQRPRLQNITGWPPRLQPSRFLEHPALYEAQDDWIPQAALNRLRASNDSAAKSLLWHWRAVQWLHQGRLHAMVLP